VSELSFLYPHLNTGAPAAKSAHVSLDDLAALAIAGWNAGVEVDRQTMTANDAELEAAAGLIMRAVAGNSRVFVVGNGGSACDAKRFVRLLGPRIDALDLLEPALVTALANDVGASRIFDRQVEAYVGPGDVTVVFTTSGRSPNIISALTAAKRSGSNTIAFAGYGGGALAGHPDVDVCFVVHSSSVHRVQEAEGALSDEIVRRVHAGVGAVPR
jgi:D-sedoheptulose 7-phosphate isomerase